MASQYDIQARQLERRRAIAEALRASGNEALPASLQTSGRFDAPVSGWAHADRALKGILGGLSERQINKAEKQLTDDQAKAQADWMRGLSEAQTPDPLRPVQNTNKLMLTDDAPISNLELDPNAPLDKAAPVGLQQQMANAVRGKKLYEEVEGQVQAGDRNKLLAHYMKGGDVGGIPAAIGAAGLQRELLPPVQEPFTLGYGDTRFGPNGKPIATGKDKPAEAGAMQLVDVIDNESPLGYRTIAESEWIAAGRPPRYHKPDKGVTVNLPPQEKAEAQTVGEWYGTAYGDIQKAGLDANAKMTKYRRMGQLMEGMNTGKLAPTVAQVQAFAESFGITLGDDLDAKQAMDALTNELALTMRNPAGGAGMPGALSDKDREFLMTLPPGISKTEGGNKLIMELGMKMAEREQKVAQLARDYRKKHGQIDEGFFDELQAFSDANPLFGDTKLPEAAVDPGALRPYDDAAKEQAYQDWKARQGQQ